MDSIPEDQAWSSDRYTYPSFNRLTKLDFYYEALSSRKEFRRALHDLNAQVGRVIRRCDAADAARYWGGAASPYSNGLLHNVLSGIHYHLRTFADKWPLPTDRGVEDLFWSLYYPNNRRLLDKSRNRSGGGVTGPAG